MPGGYPEARNLVFHTFAIMAAWLGHENIKSEEIETVVSSTSALARSHAGAEHVDL